MSQETLSILKRKAEEFEKNKESSIREITSKIGELIDKLKEVEDALMRKAEARFEENSFAKAFSMLQDDASPANVAKAEEVSRRPVLAAVYPCDEELERTREVLERLLSVVNPIPKNVAAQTDAAGAITFTWDRTANATEYRVELKGPGEGAFRAIYCGAESSTTVRGVAAGSSGEAGEYQARVCAVYGGEASGWSDVVRARPWCLVAPRGVEAASEASDSIRVAWDAVSAACGSAVSYQVEVRAADGAKSYDASKPFLVLKDLKPLTEYSVRVRAVAGQDASAWSSPSVTVKTQGPKCFMGHDLVPCTVDEVSSKFGVPGIQCDICQKVFTKDYRGTLYGCRICNCDMCPECVASFKNITKMKCRNGHPLSLVPLSVRVSGKPFNCVGCDICGNRNITLQTRTVNYPILYCCTCNYDVCAECAAKHK